MLSAGHPPIHETHSWTLHKGMNGSIPAQNEPMEMSGWSWRLVREVAPCPRGLAVTTARSLLLRHLTTGRQVGKRRPIRLEIRLLLQLVEARETQMHSGKEKETICDAMLLCCGRLCCGVHFV